MYFFYKRHAFLVGCLCLVLSCPLLAAEGDPLVVRAAQKNCIIVESHWGHQLLLSPQFLASFKNLDTPSNPARANGAAKPIRGPQLISLDRDIAHTLTRLPNEERARWTDKEVSDPNAVHVTCRHNEGAGGCLLIEVDGARLGVVAGTLTSEQRSLLEGEPLDALLLLKDGEWKNPAERRVEWIQELDPMQVIVSPAQAEFASVLQSDWEDSSLNRAAFNRLALSSTGFEGKRRITVLGAQWRMPSKLAERFDAMDSSCLDSQEVFRALSIEQLNFEPANGTHTPRWNVEHMMGRQLLFFSQIYHALDPAIPVMDLNPAQMPPDYRFAHPEWDGAEEARQMQRVLEFTRRFAYLLDGLELDERAPGSRWPTLNALLLQMEKHYKEHTANTQKKFELPDWPAK